MRKVLSTVAFFGAALVLFGACSVVGPQTAKYARPVNTPIAGKPGWYRQDRQGLFAASTVTPATPLWWIELECTVDAHGDQAAEKCVRDALSVLPTMTAEDQQHYWAFSECFNTAARAVEYRLSEDEVYAQGRACEAAS